MDKIIIQIYEIQDPAEAQAVVEFGVDHIGSVIASEDDWKLPGLKDTIDTVQAAGGKSSLIPLYNRSESVLRTLDYYQPDIVHFCEALADQKDMWRYCERLLDLQKNVKQRFPEIKIMRSIPIVQEGQDYEVPTLKISKIFEPISDFFLTDTLLVHEKGRQPALQPVQGFVGITGKTCNWEIARQLVAESQIPVILAGGISPQNVVNAIEITKPAGIDSCTQTNVQNQNGRAIRFRKDLKKVKAFVEAVRRAEAKLRDSGN